MPLLHHRFNPNMRAQRIVAEICLHLSAPAPPAVQMQGQWQLLVAFSGAWGIEAIGQLHSRPALTLARNEPIEDRIVILKSCKWRDTSATDSATTINSLEELSQSRAPSEEPTSNLAVSSPISPTL